MHRKVALAISPADGPPFEHEFQGDALVIGRSSVADLPVEDQFLSRRHARLFWQEGQLLLEDLHSRNGTFLNDQILRAPTELSAGDVIRLSGSTIHIARLEGALAAPPQASLNLEQTVFSDAAAILRRLKSAPSADSASEEQRNLLENLRILNEVHTALGRWLGMQDLLQLILDRVFFHLKPESGVIYLRQADGSFQPVACRPDQHNNLQAPQSLVEEVAKKGKAALSYDIAGDERFQSSESLVSRGIRCLLAAPLLGPGGPLGMIVLSSRGKGKKFTSSDVDLLVSLAAVAGLRLHLAELAEESARRRQLEEELALARRIQVALLPSKLPAIPGFELYAVNFPSQMVSGDYYSLVARPGGQEFIAMVTDVSGKGISASLLTASLEALAAAPIEDGLSPDLICEKLSRLLYLRTPPERYATLFMLLIKAQSDQLLYTNAGHQPGLLVRASGALEHLNATGTPVGMLRAASYGSIPFEMKSKDTLLLYTDGITEAENVAEQEYGVTRLSALLQRHHRLPLSELVDQIEEDLAEFCGSRAPTDDRTILLLRRT